MSSPPRKTDLARQLLTPGQRAAAPGELRLSGAQRALLITVDGKRGRAELDQLARGLGLGSDALQALVQRGLVELPRTEDVRATLEQARRLVSTKFFALDLVTRMLAGREGELRQLAREADTESRFMHWMDLCCARITEQADAERAAMFRSRVEAALGTPG